MAAMITGGDRRKICPERIPRKRPFDAGVSPQIGISRFAHLQVRGLPARFPRGGIPSSTQMQLPAPVAREALAARVNLDIDAPTVARQIESAIREHVLSTLKRRGVVVGLSGGIDSSVVAALAARALGRDRVLAILMPERDSSDDALRLGTEVAKNLGIEAIV